MMTSRLIPVFFALGLVACAPDNPRLMAPPVAYDVAATEAKPYILNVTPKVDVLFVIDNSASMKDEQATLSANVDKFAMSIAKNSGIDFHVGVTSVWDTKMFAGMKKDYGHGELRRLKDPKGQDLPETFGRFVSSKEDYDSYLAKSGFDLTKKPGWVQVLAASMKIGVEDFNEKHEVEHTGGPENEEVFSPVKAALDSSGPMLNGPNKGFRRGDAHLVLIFITDADAYLKDKVTGERQDITGEKLVEFLAKEVGPNYRDQVSALGVLAKSNDVPKERDPGLAQEGMTQPNNILGFIKELEGKSMGLRGSNYGVEMGKLGLYVRERTLTKPRIDLNGATPEAGTEKVTLNGVALNPGDDGWVYSNERQNSIVITRDLQDVNGVIDIQIGFTTIGAKSFNSNRVKR